MPPEENHLWIKASFKTVGLEVWSVNKEFWVLKENVEDDCVYAKFKNGKFIFLILYVDDILLASSDVSLL